MSIPNGGTVTIAANGASIAIDGSGDVAIVAIGQIVLAGGGPAIARVGDATILSGGNRTYSQWKCKGKRRMTIELGKRTVK